MLQLPLPDLVGTLVAGALTVMVLSYLAGDNVLFRIAVHVFIGVAAGYGGAAAWHGVLAPALIDPVRQQGLAGIANLEVLIPSLLILLLVFKVFPSTARAGSLPLALLAGVAAAVAVGGAVTGTIIPQVWASAESLSPTGVSPLTGETGLERSLNVAIVLVGTMATLFSFQFGVGGWAGRLMRFPATGVVVRIGHVFVALTYGAMFAGALAAAIVVLAERIQFVWGVVIGLLFAG